jgi:site-specific recombinase XerD
MELNTCYPNMQLLLENDAHLCKKKNITPHVLRHTLAMDLLHHGVDRSVIALWLGHESIETTQIYIKADLKMKEQALAKTKPFGVRPGRYQPDDYILAFLKGL